MILIKRVDAIDMLSDLASEGSSLADFLYEIQDEGMEDSLDWVVFNEFPNGVEEDELKEFFLNEQDFIRRELGINEEDEEDEGEGEQ